MANTFFKLAAITVGSAGASTINFVGIPQVYTDLCIKICSRTDRALINDEVNFTINGLTTSIYTVKFLSGNGTAASSGGGTLGQFINIGDTTGASATSNTFGNGEIYIPNYTSSNNKSILFDSVGENNATASYASLATGLFANTGAITSIALFPRVGPNFVQYSTATLYGIKNS